MAQKTKTQIGVKNMRYKEVEAKEEGVFESVFIHLNI